MAISSQPPSFSSYTNPKSSDVQSADPDIVLVNPEELPVDIQAQLVLQAIGGSELIQIARNDSIDGQKIAYQPITNIDSFAAQFSPVLITGNAPSINGVKAAAAIDIDSYAFVDVVSTGSIFTGQSLSGKPAIIVQVDNVQDGDVVEIATASLYERKFLELDITVDGGESINNYDGIVDGGDSLGYNVDITVNGGLA